MLQATGSHSTQLETGFIRNMKMNRLKIAALPGICINSSGWKASTRICDHAYDPKAAPNAQFGKHFDNCFVFVTDEMHRFVHVSQVPFIVNTLWDALLDLDDLTASTNSIMTLLSLLLTYPQVQQCRSVSTWKNKISRILSFLFLLWRFFFCHNAKG